MNQALTTALELAAAGISVIPVRADGSKAPATAWKPYTHTPATEQQLHGWFDNHHTGLGIVTGAVSGGLEMLELEGRAATELPQLRELAHDTGLGDLWDRVTRGWVETSPSGGFHFHYRLVGAPVPGNTKLARRPATPDELATAPGDRIKVLAETRGEGGFVVVAPTPGTHHPTGRPWTRLLGDPTTAPSITADERDAVHAIIRTLDAMPAPEPPERATPAPPRAGDGTTPGDDYEHKVDWADILTPHGWTLVTTRRRTRYWLRPGKDRGQGFSATTGRADDRDRLYVFTTSTDFQAETPYTKFGAYAVLEHAGDHTAAARELARQGYGTRPEQPRSTAGHDLDGLIAPTADGTTPPAPAAAPARHLRVAEPTTYTETDDGNALRLVDTHPTDIRYCPQRGLWLTWAGHRWAWDEAAYIRELARAIARDLPTHDKDAERHRKASLSKRGVDAMVNLAQSDTRTVIHLNDLDARPYELNTPDGVVDLRTGRLHPADPTALHTRSTTVAPDAEAPTPRWDRFLADTFAGDPDLTTYVQRLLGVSLVGTVLEQLLPFAFGSGANGKSVLFETVQELIGLAPHGYAISMPADLLVARARDDHPATIAQLAGARIAIGGELEEGARFAEAKVKMLSGGDPINARFMAANPFTFVPTHSLWLHANFQPEVRTGGPAFWRRIRQIPFVHTVPERDRVKNLRETLVHDEGPGILAWLIRGAADYFTHGLDEPAAVTNATAAYQHDTDTVAQFVEDRCETGNPAAQHMHVRTTTLRQAYESWCRAEGLEPVSAKALTQQLRAKYGVVQSRSSTARFYDGIRLLDVSPDDDDQTESVIPDALAEGW